MYNKKLETMKSIKYFKYIMLSAAVVFAASCEKDDTKDVDMTTRIGLSPEQENFAANGTTESGEESFVGIVTVVHGDKVNKIAWDAAIAEQVAWASVEKTVVTSNFNETFNGKVHQIQETGIEVKAEPNTEYKRSFTVEIRTADGTVAPFVFTQLGEKADAAVSTTTKDIEIIAKGGSEEIAYTTNMGDVYDFAVKYGEESSDWLSWTATEAGKVTLTASEWTNKESVRTATFTIIVGTDATSKASVDIPVVQLAADEYYYMYGESCNGLAIGNAIQLEKKDTGIYSSESYFMASADGKNPIILNRDSRILGYPCFALAADGTIAEIASADAALPAGPAIDIDGRRKITVNMTERTWSWERITVQNCMPDSELANYKTKSYIARDGSMKTWMVEWMHWDGGGTTPMMGSAMPKSATGVGAAGTGGYAAAKFPKSWDDTSNRNYAYETTEIGGQLSDFSEYGRIYSFSEMVTGVPQNGLGFARYEALPENWQTGGCIIDVFGDENIVGEYLDTAKAAAAMSGDNDADEKAYPLLKIQVQGICPYGWHVANVADWLDLAYAASQASNGDKYPVHESRVTYKQFFTISGTATSGDADSARGIGNFASWLRNHAYWPSSTVIADGADEFGFNAYPLGWRYMTQGFQCYGSRMQAWIPFPFASAKATTGAGARLQVIIDQTNGNPDTKTYAEITNIDIGQAIAPFRCVKNYKK